MDKPHMKIDVSIDDRTGEPRAVYFLVRDGFSVETREIEPNKAFADYNEEGLLLGIELLAPCSVEVLDSITQKETPKVKQFVRQSTPVGFLSSGSYAPNRELAYA